MVGVGGRSSLQMTAKHGLYWLPKSPGIRHFSEPGFNVPYAVGHLVLSKNIAYRFMCDEWFNDEGAQFSDGPSNFLILSESFLHP